MSSAHPTPAQAYEMGVLYATILRHIYNHPEFKYEEPPTAAIAKMDFEQTPPGLFFTADFIQKTYIDNVLPLLPEGASRKCKEVGNPWAYADPSYQWEWTWDAGANAMKDASGNVIAFPTLSASRIKENTINITTRNFLIKKLVLENETDIQAQMMLGARGFDFGENVRAEVAKLS
ncbi:hypothetical protein F5Y10DRAFT_203120 [Nemania abortiva]|nr:hypothetical protein F5Y10DRAFT_203120 [Nemania abortiva]